MTELYNVGYLKLLSEKNPDGGDFFYFEEEDKVVVLPYFVDSWNKINLVTLIEPIKIWNGSMKKQITCVTGTIERGEDPLICAIRELKEETGILVSDSVFYTFVGAFNFTKSCTGKRYLYIVDISKRDVIDKPTDNSWFENNTYNMISTYEDIQKLSSDVYLHFLYTYLKSNIIQDEKEIKYTSSTQTKL